MLKNINIQNWTKFLINQLSISSVSGMDGEGFFTGPGGQDQKTTGRGHRYGGRDDTLSEITWLLCFKTSKKLEVRPKKFFVSSHFVSNGTTLLSKMQEDMTEVK